MSAKTNENCDSPDLLRFLHKHLLFSLLHSSRMTETTGELGHVLCVFGQKASNMSYIQFE
jgi:hypothetical protein